MASCVPVTDPSRLSDDRYHIRESLSRPPRSSQYKKRAGIPRFCSIFLSAWLAPDRYPTAVFGLLWTNTCTVFLSLLYQRLVSELVFVSRLRRQGSFIGHEA